MRIGDLAGRGPIGMKSPAAKRNPAHMARVADLPCVCCGARPVEVHHVICGRYSQRRAPDEATIPLCPAHHRGPEGIHADKRAWVAIWGADTDYLPVVADALAGELNSPWRK